MDISEAAAGALNELTFGASNKIAGIDDIDSDAYRVGGLGAMFNPRGLVKAAGKQASGAIGKKSGKPDQAQRQEGQARRAPRGRDRAPQADQCPSGKGRYPDHLR